MDTLYNWLLHNMGNEANAFTILNVDRQTKAGGTPTLDVMARTKTFKLVNLLIQPGAGTDPAAAGPDEFDDRTPTDSYYFADDQQIIAYLSGGQPADSAGETGAAGIRVVVLEPTDASDGLTFPPE